jgi:DNA-binding FrmR family transcriptional regulator
MATVVAEGAVAWVVTNIVLESRAGSQREMSAVTAAKEATRGMAVTKEKVRHQVEAIVADPIKEDCLRQLSRIRGLLAGVREMIEEDKYVCDILRWTYTVREAVTKLEAIMLEERVRSCVSRILKDEGQREKLTNELTELFGPANITMNSEILGCLVPSPSTKTDSVNQKARG